MPLFSSGRRAGRRTKRFFEPCGSTLSPYSTCANAATGSTLPIPLTFRAPGLSSTTCTLLASSLGLRSSTRAAHLGGDRSLPGNLQSSVCKSLGAAAEDKERTALLAIGEWCIATAYGSVSRPPSLSAHLIAEARDERV